MIACRIRPLGLALVALASHLAPPPLTAQADATMSIHTAAGWRVWWRAAAAPAVWTEPHPALVSELSWRALQPGLELAELEIAAAGFARRTGVVVVRVDPARFDFRLEEARDGLRGAWTIDSAAVSAALALNAGQFTPAGPWGWVVRRGIEYRRPGRGPLSVALVVDSAGGFHWVAPDSVAAVRGSRRIREAFQSYPTLLAGGAVPAPLRAAGAGVDLEHRDSRLAIGRLRDGGLLIVLTRFRGLAGVLEELPFGLTAPEMAALLGALGARDAVMLDGGLSGQLLVRDADGDTLAWRGWRKVPLGLVALPRSDAAPAAGRRGPP